jgi:DNA-binding CsgD family transcriptional regulator
MICRMETPDPIARLTEREKVCLRLWLQHKSAKEIATDLAITHHAVEKRLKMARVKLGASSSREAARLLQKAEAYGLTVTPSPDLAVPPRPGQSAVDRKLIIAGVVMSLIAVVALVLAMQPAAPAPLPPPTEAVLRERDEQLNILLGGLMASVEIDPEGEIWLTQPFLDGRFLEPGSGYYWQISAEGREDFTSRSLWDRTLKPSGRPAPMPIHYTSTQFPDEPLRVVEQTVMIVGSDVRWRFMVARPHAAQD